MKLRASQWSKTPFKNYIGLFVKYLSRFRTQQEILIYFYHRGYQHSTGFGVHTRYITPRHNETPFCCRTSPQPWKGQFDLFNGYPSRNLASSAPCTLPPLWFSKRASRRIIHAAMVASCAVSWIGPSRRVATPLITTIQRRTATADSKRQCRRGVYFRPRLACGDEWNEMTIPRFPIPETPNYKDNVS